MPAPIRDPARWRLLRSLLGELAERPEAERESFLSGLDEAVAGELRDLIEADDPALSGRFMAGLGGLADEWLDARTGGESDDEAARFSEMAGTDLGPWRLQRPLGRGGMAEVWDASRADGEYEHHVAVKLLKRGMDSEEIVARFRRERQILARLEHPAIARILDGGVAPDGRPYLVLERVDGEPVTRWCHRRGLVLEARVRLLVEVCEAVAAAHRQLIVHRDLKPSNILVGNDGRPRLLDFGIAKLLDDGGGAHATRSEMRILTPAYAAPEQLRGDPVTTATDVYALGRVAWELLTGSLPERPSPPDGDGRGRSGLPADLELVLRTALRSEPERRYSSVDLFADDLRNFLAGRPVTARADTLGYRVRRFVGRHRASVAVSGFALVGLVAALGAALVQAHRAEANARAAARNADSAEQVKEFLIDLFEVADPSHSGGDVPIRELVEQAGRRLEGEIGSDSTIRADLLEAVARIDKGLGLTGPAAQLAEAALDLRLRELPADHPAVAKALATVGAIETDQGRLAPATDRLERAVRALERSEPANSLTLARARGDWATALFWLGRLDEAEALQRRVWRTYLEVLGPDNVQTAANQAQLAILLEDLDRLDEAEAAYRSAQQVIERVLGEDHPYLAEIDLSFAVLLERRDRFAEAERLFRRALDIRVRRLGPHHLTTGQAWQLYSLFLLHRGRLDEAERGYHQALAVLRAINPRHWEIGKSLNGLALIAGRRGDHARAEAMLREVVELFRETLGEEHHFFWLASANLAQEVADQGRFATAEGMLRDSVAHLEKLTGLDSDETGQVLGRLGSTLRASGRPAEAEAVLARARRIAVAVEGESSLRAAAIDVELALCRKLAGDVAAARELLDRAERSIAGAPAGDAGLTARIGEARAGL